MTKVAIIVLAGLCLVTEGQVPNRRPTNRPPVITTFESSSPTLTFCPEFCESSDRKSVTLSVAASDPDGDELEYSYSLTAGEVLGAGSQVTWRLTGQPSGTYIATVKVTDSKAAEATATVKVQIKDCRTCFHPDPPCPLITVSSFSKVAHRGENALFEVTVMTGYFLTRPDYTWSVERGKILKGQHTPRIEVEATGDIGAEVSATVLVGGLDGSCSAGSAASLPIEP